MNYSTCENGFAFTITISVWKRIGKDFLNYAICHPHENGDLGFNFLNYSFNAERVRYVELSLERNLGYFKLTVFVIT